MAGSRGVGSVSLPGVCFPVRSRLLHLTKNARGLKGKRRKDVAVPFNAIHFTDKNNNKWYMVMNTTKDAMKAAPGLKYDRNSMTWIPEGSTTGGPAPAPR